jgi:CRISPR-associated protein Csb2
MTTTVEFSFPWGRYHATAWDRNANEGAPDWPPAPWRILRALYAAWKWHCPDIEETVVHGLLDKLSDPPRYQLPRFRIAHTRHYYPETGHKEGVKAMTAKTLDAFVVTERGAILTVDWPVDLNTEERDALTRVLDGIAYLGRADSLVDAELKPGDTTFTDDPWTRPDAESSSLHTQPLLIPTRPLDIDDLTARAVTLRAHRFRQPPGTRWVRYAVPAPATVTSSTPRRQSAEPRQTDIAIRFSLTGQPVSRFEAVTMADTLRSASLSAYGGERKDVEWQLAGKTADGKASTEPHRHAHFFAFNPEDRKPISTLVVWVPAGLSTRALNAVAQNRPLYARSLERPWRSKGRSAHSRMIAVEASGPIELVAPELCGPDTIWHTITPFGITRHARELDDGFIADNVARELSSRGLPSPSSVRVLKSDALSYTRKRPNRDQPRRAYGLELTFPERVAGPIALGHLSHFSLGLFAPGPRPNSRS